MKKLYFKEKFFKITDHYPILDETGRAAYYLDQDFTFVGYRSKVTDANGHELFRIDRQIISFFPKYTISFADNTSMVIQERLAVFRKKVDVYLDNETLYLNGDLLALNFEVLNDKGQIVGDLNKKFFAMTDTFELTIYHDQYIEELIALVICVNNILDITQNKGK